MDSKSTDISDYNNNSDFLFITISVLIIDIVIIFLARYMPSVFGESLNIWYDKFGIAAVLSDVTIILIGFQIARYIYTTFIAPNNGWNPLYFVILLVIVQAIHDVLFYVGIILPLPKGLNEMIDVFKRYSKGGLIIIGSDSLFMISSFLISIYLKSQPIHITTSTILVALYTLPYILYNKH